MTSFNDDGARCLREEERMEQSERQTTWIDIATSAIIFVFPLHSGKTLEQVKKMFCVPADVCLVGSVAFVVWTTEKCGERMKHERWKAYQLDNDDGGCFVCFGFISVSTHGVHFRWWTGEHHFLRNLCDQQLWTTTRAIRISTNMRRVKSNYNLFIYRWIVLSPTSINLYFSIIPFHSSAIHFDIQGSIIAMANVKVGLTHQAHVFVELLIKTQNALSSKWKSYKNSSELWFMNIPMM